MDSSWAAGNTNQYGSGGAIVRSSTISECLRRAVQWLSKPEKPLGHTGVPPDFADEPNVRHLHLCRLDPSMTPWLTATDRHTVAGNCKWQMSLVSASQRLIAGKAWRYRGREARAVLYVGLADVVKVSVVMRCQGRLLVELLSQLLLLS